MANGRPSVGTALGAVAVLFGVSCSTDATPGRRAEPGSGFGLNEDAGLPRGTEPAWEGGAPQLLAPDGGEGQPGLNPSEEMGPLEFLGDAQAPTQPQRLDTDASMGDDASTGEASTGGGDASTDGDASTGRHSSMPQEPTNSLGNVNCPPDTLALVAINESQQVGTSITSRVKLDRWTNAWTTTWSAVGGTLINARRNQGHLVCDEVGTATVSVLVETSACQDSPTRTINVNCIPAVPREPPSTRVTQLSQDGGRCAVTENGTITCTDNILLGEEMVAKEGVFVQVVQGDEFACGLTSVGAIRCVGWLFDGVLEPPPGSYVQLSASETILCGVLTDGAAKCWGKELGITIVGSPAPYRVANHSQDYSAPIELLDGIAHVSVGPSERCALGVDNNTVCWGLDDWLLDHSPPQGTFTQLSTGTIHACALAEDGSIHCWGQGEVTPPQGAYTQISAGRLATCAIAVDGAIKCWGSGLLGKLSPPEGSFTQVSLGWDGACAITEAGAVQCWGDRSLF